MTTSSFRMRDRVIRDHTVTVPLDWSAPDPSRSIEVFAREVAHVDRQDAPLLVFLQGGPGGKGPRPMPGGDWIDEALKTHRLLLLDQRGTGRSTRLEAASIAGMTADEAASYIRLFRAEQIVADLEHLRREVFGGVRWQTLGQSYGGFLTLTYLSSHPDAVSAAYVTGGLTSFEPHVVDVYRRTLPRVAAKTAEFHRRHPQDADVLARVVEVIEGSDVRLPSGDRLTARRLQTIGIEFGTQPGFDRVHWLLDEAFSRPGVLSDHFLAEVDAHTQHWSAPLYALLQEEIYADGDGPTAWAAERVRHELGGFDAADEVAAGRPMPFTGEMFFPWMYDEIASLRPFRDAAHALADREDHPRLYDAEQLRRNAVPVAAAMYFDDMYVDFGYAHDTARAMPSTHLWVTNEYEHDGLRQDPRIVRALIDRVVAEGGPLG
ncbi:alpha/beta fold hydrolase [Microbacterium marinilacus]|uniref:Alpha/beta fold hydrolase n=1 Tax=Microbacterium marinilacus TaxID=415209 RepID=A0ABP7BDH7_9MICO|nr:alpha/beta fold hydrolase [Microbacterium marinilacus]MBY0689361.1 alpha/beta hydrolase [Microbacterium marinilacus]